MGVIYKITNPTGRIYIGKTYNLKRRIICHKCNSKRETSGIILLNSIRKYGWDAHILNVVEEVEDALLNEREIFWIKEFNSYCYDNPEGMNMTKGGDGQRTTWKHDKRRVEQQKERFRIHGANFQGKRHTEENKAIISQKTSARNIRMGIKVPQWAAEKGWQTVRRPVIVYDNNGNFIGEYISLTECAKANNIGIGSVKDSLLYGSWISGKFLIKYKTENYPLRIEVGEIKVQTTRRPVIYHLNSYQIVYPSALEASLELGIPKTTINRAAQYNKYKPIRTGHIFSYLN